MTEVPLTGWFEGAERPFHVGVYQRRWPAGPYACWDGSQWRRDTATPAAAATQAIASTAPDAPWRGLAIQPAQPCLTCNGHGVIDRGWDDVHEADLISECPDCEPSPARASTV